MGQHNLFSPSGAHIWSRCVASGLLKQQYGIDKQDTCNIYTAKGTRVHTLFEALGKKVLHGKDIDLKIAAMDKEERGEYDLAREAMDYVESDLLPLYNQKGAYTTNLEGKRPLSLETKAHGTQAVGGTSDLAIFEWASSGFLSEANPTLMQFGVFDLKTGRADIIKPYKNEQLILYAMGEIHALEKEGVRYAKEMPVTLGTLQPTLNYFAEWYTTVDEIQTLYRKICHRLVQGYIKPVAGSHCKYCPVKQVCHEITDTLEELTMLTENTTLLKNLPDARKIELLKKRGAIERLFRELEQEFIGRIQLLGGIKGMRVLENVKRETYRDEVTAEKFLTTELGEKAYSKQLLTLAKARAALADKYHQTDAVKTKKGAKELAATALAPYVIRPPSEGFKLVIEDNLLEDDTAQKATKQLNN